MTPRARAAARIVEILDSPFLRALTEPARLEVLRVLLVHGPGDIGAIAAHLPQDRSVVSRHLRVLQDVGVVAGRKEGRHVIFSLEGGALMESLERILGEARSLAPLCCPPATPAATSTPATSTPATSTPATSTPAPAAAAPRRRSPRAPR